MMQRDINNDKTVNIMYKYTKPLTIMSKGDINKLIGRYIIQNELRLWYGNG